MHNTRKRNIITTGNPQCFTINYQEMDVIVLNLHLMLCWMRQICTYAF